MAGLTITITDAGRAALPNAQNNGTAPVVISHVGVSSTHTPGSLKGLTILPGELKRLTTFAGDVVAADILHVTVRDETSEVYPLRAFGLYLSTGVLFAVCSSQDVIAEKSANAMVLLAIDVAIKTLDTAMIEFGGTGFTNPPATIDRQGVVELATPQETAAGADNSRAVTPLGLLFALQTWATNFAAAVHGHTVGQISGLDAALAGKAAAGHKHDAADTTSGTFDVARIPNLAIDKITGLVNALQNKAAAIHGHVMNDIDGLVQALNARSLVGHKHDASDTTSGTFDVGRIPALAMEKITGLANALAQKASLSASVIFADVRVFDGAGGGVVYLGDLTHFLVFDGVNYNLPNAPLISAGGTVWTSATFNPATKATLGVNANFRDVIAGRTATDGVYYFGTNAGRWLAYSAGRYELIGAGGLTINGYQTWTAENFNPNLKADMASPSFTGTAYFGAEKRGQIWLMGGDDRAGVMEFRVDGVRYGFIGYGDGPEGNLYFGTDNGKAWIFTQRPSFAGYMPWDTANLAFASGAEVVAGAEHAKMISPAGLFAFAKSLGASGYAVIPGTGLMIQWGVVIANIPEGQTHAILPTAFGGGCLVAQATPRNPTSNYNSDFYMQVVSRYQDRIVFFANRANGSAGNLDGYEWFALGRVNGSPDPAYSTGGGNPGGGGQIEP